MEKCKWHNKLDRSARSWPCRKAIRQAHLRQTRAPTTSWSDPRTRIVGSPDDFGNLIAAETEKWAKVVRFAGIKAE
jgi:hypothetical protein